MRADAARNADTVLQTAARVLRTDPGASMATIAAEAGVDRSTVYRRFAGREALLEAIYAAKMAAADAAMETARLEQAEPLIALHRWVQETIAVSRQWPVELAGYHASPATAAHTAGARARLDAFVARAQAAGVIDPALPVRWVRSLLTDATTLAAHKQTELDPGPAADLVVRTFLNGTST